MGPMEDGTTACLWPWSQAWATFTKGLRQNRSTSGRVEASSSRPRGSPTEERPSRSATCRREVEASFEHGVGWQLLATNPASTAKPPRPERTDVRSLSLEQVQALLATAQNFQDQYPAIVALAASTGMRQGELLALRWSDCDLASGVARVARTARRFAGSGIVYGDPKTY